MAFDLRRNFDISPEDVAVEFHGLIFDLILFGIIITVFDLFDKRAKDKKRWLEELDDYRYFKSKTASNRITGILHRLNKNNYYQIDLTNIKITGAVLWLVIGGFWRIPINTLTKKAFKWTLLLRTFKTKDLLIFNLFIEKSSISSSLFQHIYFSDFVLLDIRVTNTQFKLCHLLIGNFKLKKAGAIVFQKCIIEKFDLDFIDADIGGVKFENCAFFHTTFKVSESDLRRLNSDANSISFENCHFWNCNGLPFLDKNGNFNLKYTVEDGHHYNSIRWPSGYLI